VKKCVLDYSLEELKEELSSSGELPYRAKQVFSGIHKKGACSFGEIKGLPKELAAKLDKKFSIHTAACKEHLISGEDGTEKFLWRLNDGRLVETVLIKEKRRKTICLSTQVGCRFKCTFCASGKKGFVRDLKAYEMVEQVLNVREETGFPATNIVFMGMGEPLDNFDNLEKAIRIINHPDGINLGARRMTVSTCGIVPGIKKLKDIGLQVELSVSLHAGNDELRNELAPVNRKYPLKKLLAACEEYTRKTARVITLEYTLINGRNDSPKDAEELAGIARRLKAKINLIGCTGDNKEDKNKKGLIRFRDLLQKKKARVTIRRSKGEDIMAACGQLAARKSGGSR